MATETEQKKEPTLDEIRKEADAAALARKKRYIKAKDKFRPQIQAHFWAQMTAAGMGKDKLDGQPIPSILMDMARQYDDVIDGLVCARALTEAEKEEGEKGKA